MAVGSSFIHIFFIFTDYKNNFIKILNHYVYFYYYYFYLQAKKIKSERERERVIVIIILL
jgi:hypothetical protein